MVQYDDGALSFDDALEIIPPESNFVHSLIPQYKRCQGKKVTLVFGSCPLKDVRVLFYEDDNRHIPFTLRFVRQLEAYGDTVLLVDLRKVGDPSLARLLALISTGLHTIRRSSSLRSCF